MVRITNLQAVGPLLMTTRNPSTMPSFSATIFAAWRSRPSTSVCLGSAWWERSCKGLNEFHRAFFPNYDGWHSEDISKRLALKELYHQIVACDEILSTSHTTHGRINGSVGGSMVKHQLQNLLIICLIWPVFFFKFPSIASFSFLSFFFPL